MLNAEIIKYHNDMNLVAFKEFNEVDFNNFFAVCHKLKERNTSKITLTFSELKKISSNKSNSNERFIRELKNTYSKLIKLSMPVEDENGDWTIFTLFSDFTISPKTQTLTAKTNERFEYVLNDLTGNFTRFELEEFVNLSSRYTKTIYRLLKQFRKTGFWIIEWEEFLRVVDIPKSYQVSDIDKRIIKRVLEDLHPFFLNLKSEKIKERKRGGKITHIKFTFDRDAKIINKEATLFEVEASKFTNFIGKKIDTTDGEKEIIVVEDLGDMLKIYFETGSVLVPDEKLLEKAIIKGR